MYKQIEAFYVKNRNKLVNRISKRLGGDRASAEDVVQEAFARCLYFQHSYDPELGKLEVWFNKILYNALRDFQNESRAVIVVSDSNICVEEVLVHFPKNRAVSKMIQEKIEDVRNEKHYQILRLFFVLGYSSKEISQIEDKVTVTNVTTVVKRFRDKLSEELKWR